MSNSTTVQKINKELEVLQKEINRFQATVEYLNNAKNIVESSKEQLLLSENSFLHNVRELVKSYDSLMQMRQSLEGWSLKIDSIDFPTRLTNIEQQVSETINSIDNIRRETIDELRVASATIVSADFDGKFQELTSVVQLVVDSNHHLASTILNLEIEDSLKRFEQLASIEISRTLKEIRISQNKHYEQIRSIIQNMEFSARMDVVDTNLFSVVNRIQVLQGKIDSFERIFHSRIKEFGEIQKDTASENKQELNMKIDLVLSSISLLENKILILEASRKISNYVIWFLIATSIVVGLIF